MEDLIKGELDWHNKVNENFHEVDSQMADIAYQRVSLTSSPFNADKTGVNTIYTALINAVNSLTPNGGTVVIPPGKYYLDQCIIFNNKKNINILGLPGATIIFDSTHMIMRFDNSDNCTISGITFSDINYTDNVYFDAIPINYASLIGANTETHLNQSNVGNVVTLSANETAVSQTKYYYSTQAIELDPTKEYTLQVASGFITGENYSVPTLTTTDQSLVQKTLIFDNQIKGTDDSTKDYRWQTMYIPIDQVSLRFNLPYTKINNASNNAVNYDLSKIKLYAANKPLPASADSYNIGASNESTNIHFENLRFVGCFLNPLQPIGSFDNPLEDISIENITVINCLNGGINASYVNRLSVNKIRAIADIKASNGDTVYYTKTSFTAIGGYSVNDYQITNSFIKGYFFGIQVGASNRLNIDNINMDEVKWGISTPTSYVGLITNITMNMMPNYIMGVELPNSDLTIQNIKIKGMSYYGIGVSVSGGASLDQLIDNVLVEGSKVAVQFDCGYIKILNSVLSGYAEVVKQLAGSGTTQSLILENTRLIKNLGASYGDNAYYSSFLSLGSSVNPIKYFKLSNVKTYGIPTCNRYIIYADEFQIDYFQHDTTSETVGYSELHPTSVSNKYSKIIYSYLVHCIIYNGYDSTNSIIVLDRNYKSGLVNQSVVASSESNIGIATINGGSNTAIVSHSLGISPVSIIVTAQGNIGNVWVTNITTTQFIINCSVAPPINTIVMWKAEI